MLSGKTDSSSGERTHTNGSLAIISPIAGRVRAWLLSPVAGAILLALGLCAFLNFLFVTVSAGAAHPMNLYPWDSGWYRSIVEQGYRFNGNYSQQQNIAFTPTYPVLCRFIEKALHTDTSLAMHIVSSACFFITLVFFYLLVAKLVSPAFAVATTVVYATNPFTLFQLFGYGDVVFITSVAVFFYALEVRRSPLAAAICVSIAGASRPYGVLLLAPLLFALAVTYWRSATREKRVRMTVRSWIIYTPVATLGLLLYTMWSQRRFGDPIAFLHIHDAWNVTCQVLGWSDRLRMTNLIASIQPVFTQDLLNPPGIAALFVVCVSILAVLTASYRRLPPSMNCYWILLTGFLLASSTGCHPNLVALGRHTLGIIPLFLLLMIMVARLCDYPLEHNDRSPASSAATRRLLLAAAVIAFANVVVLCNYIHRFFLLQWVA